MNSNLNVSPAEQENRRI